MTEERSDPQTEPTYTGRVLPGSRWRQRAYSGHTEQEVTVLRVGQRSVMLVIEGGGNGGKLSGHDRQKVGQRFNVILETFLKTHTLIEQPKGYRPGDEVVPAPKKDTVETYFRRRRYAQEWIDNMEGDNIRAATLDPRLPVVPDPVYEGDAFLAHPVVAAEVDRRVEEVLAAEAADTSPPPPEEEPMSEEPEQTTHIEAQRIIPLEAEDGSPHRVSIVEYEDLPTEPVLPDPVQAFIDTGHGAVRQLTTELDLVGQDRDHHLAMAEVLDRKYQRLKVNRDRIESAVLAALAAIEGEPEPPPPASEEPQDEPDEEMVGVELASGPPPWEKPQHTRPGPAPAVQGTQRSWVLDRLAQAKHLHVGTVADEFAADWGLSRESAIKNIASILGAQTSNPAPQWPPIRREGKGYYVVVSAI